MGLGFASNPFIPPRFAGAWCGSPIPVWQEKSPQRKKGTAGAALERRRKPISFLENVKDRKHRGWEEIEGKVGASGTPELTQEGIWEPWVTAGTLLGLG